MILMKELDLMFQCMSDRWKDQIVFTPNDISVMLNIPLGTVHSLCRSGKLETFKIGRSYRIPRQTLYDFIKQCIEDSIIL